MPRPADVGHQLLSLIPEEPSKIDTTRLHKLLEQEGISRTPRAIQQMLRTLAREYSLRCFDKTKPYQWQWTKGARAREFAPMSAHTALTLKLAHAHLGKLLPPATLDLLKTQLRRADEVLAGTSGDVRSWDAKIRIFPPGLNLLPPEVAPEILAAVCNALLTGRRLDATYRARGRKTDNAYDVHPLVLVSRGPLLTLVCMIEGTQEPRQLHLHRFRSASVTQRRAAAPHGFDVDRHLAEGNIQFRVGPSIRLRATIDAWVAETLGETRLSADQRLEQKGEDAFLVEATVPDTRELHAWLRSYGARIEVLGPPELREQFAREARELAAKYGGDATSTSPPRPRKSPAPRSGRSRGRNAGSVA